MEKEEIVIEIARKAGKIFRDGWFKDNLKIEFKGKINPVTEIDKKSEAFLKESLKRNFPDYGFLTEESCEETGNVNTRWIIDPLDGTTNFTRRYPFVAVSIALEKDGELVFGLVYNPILDEMFIGEKGKGAFRNGKAISVSSTSELKNAVLCSGFPYDAWVSCDNNTKQWSKFITHCISLRCDGSSALDMCRVACGQTDGYWEKGIFPWDIAAGIVIVREAGGKVSDYSGGNDYFKRGEVIAANPSLHAKMSELINS